MLNIIKTGFEGLVILEPKVFEDERGYFFESYNKSGLEKLGININFVQDNESKSAYGVIRGLHYQLNPVAQTKLIRVVSGKIIDIALDLRRNSPTFGTYYMVELSDTNKKQFFIPHGFAHGFSVISDSAVINYKCDNFYSKEHERGINPVDPALGIDWKIDKSKQIISEKDSKAPSFDKVDAFF
jgi:dTDP-4-dehydrorhamnose 3,5-epimerase